MKVTIKNIETNEIEKLDEAATLLYTEGMLGRDIEGFKIAGVDTSDENWDSLIEEIWE